MSERVSVAAQAAKLRREAERRARAQGGSTSAAVNTSTSRFGAPPVAPAEVDEPQFIGVPSDYVATGRMDVPYADYDWNYRHAPKYQEGEQFSIAGLAPGELSSLQRSLVDAGLLRSDFMLGYADDRTLAAFEDLLSLSNRSGMDWRTQLLNLNRDGAYTGGSGGSGGSGGATVRLSNRADVVKLMKRTATSMIGHTNHDFDPEAAADAYLAQQRAQQQALMAGTSTVEEVQDVSSFAEDQVLEVESDLVGARGMLGAAQVVNRMISGG